MEENTELTSPAGPGLADVLMQVADDADNLPSSFDKVEIFRATDREYTYRVYPVGTDDYEGGYLTFYS